MCDLKPARKRLGCGKFPFSLSVWAVAFWNVWRGNQKSIRYTFQVPTLSSIEEIYVYTDSTGLPRSRLVSPKEIWAKNLADASIPVILRGSGGSNSNDLLKQLKKDAFYFAFDDSEESSRLSLLVLFFGIVDSAPRPITFILRHISKIPIIGPRAWKYLSRYVLKPFRPIIQKIWRYRLISPRRFRENLNDMLRVITNPNVVIALCCTPIPSEYVLKRSPGFERSVRQYNKIKRGIAVKYPRIILVDLEAGFRPEYVSQEDGHHFSAKDHELISVRISESIDAELRKV